MSEAHVCNHPMVPHTLWWWIEDGGISPMSRTFDDLEDADRFAKKLIRQYRDGGMSWLKIFRSDNESYTCFMWEKPKENKVSTDDQHIKLEVDMEPLKIAFDNVALGFKEQGKAIRRLTISQLIFSTSFIVYAVVDMLR